MKRERGFTLIELLAVIAIISLLSAIALATLNGQRERGRDARRMADLAQIQRALELYHAQNGSYPDVNQAQTGVTDCGVSNTWCTLETALSPYISRLPRDPLGATQTSRRYYYDSDSGDGNQSYGLMAQFEHASNQAKCANDGGYYNTCTTGNYYELGEQPSYCKNVYNENWWTGTTVGSLTTKCATQLK